LFNLAQTAAADIGDSTDGRPIYRRFSDRKQPVIADCHALFLLFRPEHPDKTHGDKAAGKRRRIHEHEDIQSVAVLGAGARHGTEIERKPHAGRQDAAQAK